MRTFIIMKTGTNIQKIAREFWRLIEVYLFFLVSVLGSTGFTKAPSSLSSKSKEHNTQNEIVLLVPLQTHAHLIAPPKTCNFVFNSTFYHKEQSKNSAGDDDASQQVYCSSYEKLSCKIAKVSPFLTPTEFYRNQHKVLHTSLSIFPGTFYSSSFAHFTAPLLI